MINLDIKAEQILSPEYRTHVSKLKELDKVDNLLNKPIPTGISLLDNLLDGGFKRGELCILSAPTKQGKSTLAQTISWNMGKKNKSTLWLTMEMSWQELTRKFMLMDKDYQADNNSPSHQPIFYPIDYYRSGGELQIEWLREIIKHNMDNNNIEFVIIDHLHFLLPLKDYNTNVSFLIGAIVREIKKMAVELKIPIMLIAHTKKIDIDKTPDINSIRDSSFIAQESDFTMIMWRIRSKPKKGTHQEELDSVVYTRKAYLSLEANRRTGDTGRIKLWHNGTGFEQYDKEVHNALDGKEEVPLENIADLIP